MAFLNWLLKHITLLAHLTVDEGFVDVDFEVAWHSIPAYLAAQKDADFEGATETIKVRRSNLEAGLTR